MPLNTFAQLITDVMQGLGFPPKNWLEVEDVARAVTQALQLTKQVTTFSNQNLDLRHYDWDPSSRDESLLGAPDISVPAWVERQISTSTDDYWQFVPTCNLAVLEEARTRGEYRCAFYVDQGQLRIRFSYKPEDQAYQSHRLWFDPAPWIAQTFNDIALDTSGTAIPANFAPLISGMAEINCISTMRIRAAMDKESPPSTSLISAWNDREKLLMAVVGPIPTWADRLNHFAHGARGARRGQRRRNVLRRLGSSW